MTEHKMVKWGVIGCASIATQVMIPGIQSSRNGRVVAVGSRSKETASRIARDFGIPRAYGSYEEVVEDHEVEAIYVPLPNALHKEWTIRAAEAGKHVLCEKTLALDSGEAQEMARACQTHGVTLMEGFAVRFHPQNLFVKKLIAEDRIGKALHISSMFSTPRPAADNINLSKKLGGGVMREKGCYCVNLPRFIYEDEPTRVFASATFGAETGVDERVTTFLQFPGRRGCFFDTGYGMTGSACYQSYEVFGERGRIYVPRAVFQIETAETGAVVDTWIRVSQDRFRSAESKEEIIPVKGANQWQLEAEYFSDRVLAGSGIEFPAEDGLGNMKVMDAIYQSGRLGAPVDL